jgi:hypothetical protein
VICFPRRRFLAEKFGATAYKRAMAEVEAALLTRENLSETEPFGVLAGLVPAIHAALLQ